MQTVDIRNSNGGVDHIRVRGARVHNLKNLNVDIPRGKLVVITGVSGSGKSSLAFDTLFAEGQRRYVESLSAYARQFLGQLEKPDVDLIEGLSPAIAIDQRGVSSNPRSTVGTITEIHDHLRLLFARVGDPHCPQCGRPVRSQSVQQMVDTIMAKPEGTRLILLAPVVRGRRGEHRGVFADALRAGFVRARVDGDIMDVSPAPKLDKNRNHDIDIVVDRIVVRDDLGNRLADSLETALKLGGGFASVQVLGGDEVQLSELLTCPYDGISFPEIEPRSFSFNSPRGACPECDGLGVKMEFDPDLVIPDRSLSIRAGAIAPWSRIGGSQNTTSRVINALSRKHDFGLDDPISGIDPKKLDLILYGIGDDRVSVRLGPTGSEGRVMDFEFEGVIPYLRRRYESTESDYVRRDVERYMAQRECPECRGGRIRRDSAAVKFAGQSIVDVSWMSVRDCLEFLAGVTLAGGKQVVAEPILGELGARLTFLKDVGLDYLTLDRRAATLSGGEAQRIRLATQIGSRLSGVLYILDEPSIGLHQRDNARLLATLEDLRDRGNSVLVVEHDEAAIRRADWIVDLGPGAGLNGGELIAEGSVNIVEAAPRSLTGNYLCGEQLIETPGRRRGGNGLEITIEGASANNLKDIDVRFPLAMFVGVTGVSGSGKSSLVNDVLYRSAARRFYRSREVPGAHRRISGLEWLDKVIDIDQSAIGRTPRSNPATYSGTFGPIRELFAAVPEARARGYKPGRFSFNVKGGRCEVCQGAGVVRIEMQFLPDVYVECETCNGLRYNREALEIRYRGYNVADVLAMSVNLAADVFGSIPNIARRLESLQRVGLGYLTLGQQATTLSGGEAQRVKLATELAKRSTGKTLYILDEPTTGLHFDDVRRLVDVLQQLVDAGNTVVVIEHNLDVIKSTDWVIDLGPDGGEGGGRIVAEGKPEHIATTDTYTGRFLSAVLQPRGGVAIA